MITEMTPTTRMRRPGGRNAPSTSNTIVSSLLIEAYAQGLCDADLAKIVRVHVNTISNWKHGKVSPSADNIVDLMSSLNLSFTMERKN